MVTSQILKTVDFTNIQKFRYLENKTLIFSKKVLKYYKIKSIIVIYYQSIINLAATAMVSVKAHKFYKSFMFKWSHIFLVKHIMVNKVKIICSHQADFSYPVFFKLVWLTSALIYTLNIYMTPTYSYEKQKIKLFLSESFLKDKLN